MLDVRVVGVCPAHTHTQYQDYVLLIHVCYSYCVRGEPTKQKKTLLVIASGHVLNKVYACWSVRVWKE